MTTRIMSPAANYKLPQTVADSIHTARRDSTDKCFVASTVVAWHGSSPPSSQIKRSGGAVRPIVRSDWLHCSHGKRGRSTAHLLD